MKQLLLVFLLLLLAGGIAFLVFYQQPSDETSVAPQGVRQEELVAPVTAAATSSEYIGLNELLSRIEYADTPTLRTKGLSNRALLPENTGLFFVFETSDKHGIWMKDMLFPIDIIWFDKSGGVVGLKENATPASFPEVFYPESNAWYVLETNVGFIARHALEVGDAVLMPNR